MLRVTRAGGKMVLDPSILVYHDHPPESARASFTRAFIYARSQTTVMRSGFGKIVSGSESGAMITISALFKELMLVSAITTLKEIRLKACQGNVWVGLFQYFAIRFFSPRLGRILGAITGSVSKQRNIMDLHTWTRDDTPFERKPSARDHRSRYIGD